MADEELYKKYRPKRLKDLIGQDELVKVIEKLFASGRFPHACILGGPSGCGKTTIARILKKRLECSDTDFRELNAADSKGIDTIREIRSKMHLSPLNGRCRIYLLDEAHQLTGPAQDAFLKMLEDTPEHVYFLLATTAPDSLSKTVRTRCTQLIVKPFNAKACNGLVQYVCEKEGITISEDVMDALYDKSENSARQVLVLLNAIANLDSEDEQLEAIRSSDVKSKAFDIARALMKRGVKWGEVAVLLGSCVDHAETVRHVVLGYCRKIMLGGGKNADVAYRIISIFRDNFYDSKDAGLAAACWEVVHGL